MKLSPRLSLHSVFLLPLLLGSLFASALAHAENKNEPVRIAWIGAMTGPVSKYAAFQAATLALEDINAKGGINGRPLSISFQDGKCQAKDAIDAVNSVIEREHLHFLVGGHCSTESLAMAPVVERQGALMIAASSSSPKLSAAGDHVFRVTAPNLRGIELLVPHILKGSSQRSVAVIYEETEYAQGMAEYFQKLLTEGGGKTPVSLAYKLGEGDFLSFVTRIKSSGAEAVYLSVQSPDSAILFLTKAKQLGLNLPLYGNEISGNAVQSATNESTPYFEGMVFSEPQLPANYPPAEDFTRRYKERFHVDKLPNGFWSMEAYDAVRVLADAITRCGEDVEKVKTCLYQTKDYKGVSGSIGFDSNGDGVRVYGLKVIQAGKILELPPEKP